MFWAGLRNNFVAWAFWRDGLEDLLKLPFRIDLKWLLGQPLDILQRLVQYETPDDFNIAIEIHRADQCFERVSKNGGSLSTAACFFASAHHQVSAQADVDGVHFQTFAGDESRTQFC